MGSKGPPQPQVLESVLPFSKATCDSVLAEGLLSRLLSLNSFKLDHGHYLSVSLQHQVTRQQLFPLCYFFFNLPKRITVNSGKQS